MYKIIHSEYGVCVAEVFAPFEFDDFKRGKVIHPSKLDMTHHPWPEEDYDPAYTYVAIAPKCCLEFKVIGLKPPRPLLWHDLISITYVLDEFDTSVFRIVEHKEESVTTKNVVKRKRPPLR